MFTVHLKVLLGPLFMLYSYNYDISDHTNSPFFSWDCNGKDANAIPAVSGQISGGGWVRSEAKDGRRERWFLLPRQTAATSFTPPFQKLIHLSPYFL